MASSELEALIAAYNQLEEAHHRMEEDNQKLRDDLLRAKVRCHFCSCPFLRCSSCVVLPIVSSLLSFFIRPFNRLEGRFQENVQNSRCSRWEVAYKTIIKKLKYQNANPL